jgi:predicted ribosomally synthesized peptide with SipW-like signal peptide
VLTLGVVLGLGSVSTLAYWSDEATVTGGTFEAGTLDLEVDGVQGNPTPYAFNTFAASNLAPGESVAASFDVENTGSIGFTYTATATAAGALAPHVRFTVKTGGTAGNTGTSGANNRAGTCTGGTAQVSDVTLSGTATTVAPTAESVSAGASQGFCIVATLDSGTPSAQGGNSASATFVVNAKQVGAP